MVMWRDKRGPASGMVGKEDAGLETVAGSIVHRAEVVYVNI